MRGFNDLFFLNVYNPQIHIDHLLYGRPSAKERNQAFKDKAGKLRRGEYVYKIIYSEKCHVRSTNFPGWFSKIKKKKFLKKVALKN